MPTHTVTAQAAPNIAFIKYWGNRDQALRLPANGSISMNLEGLTTHTTVSFQPSLALDELIVNGHEITGPGLERASSLLNEVRAAANISFKAKVNSENNFPTGAGIASSASAFAALAMAATQAAGLDWDEAALSRLARHGSGSACRSIPGGFVEWKMGSGDKDSFAVSIAPADHWALCDCIAVVNTGAKSVGSTEGHALANTSPLQAARLADAPRRLDICRRAVLGKDFDALANVIELDSNMMHAIMMTSTPPLVYWEAGSLDVIHAVLAWRKNGTPAAFTVDAGPNVHVLCPQTEQARIVTGLKEIPGVQKVLTAHPGGPATSVA